MIFDHVIHFAIELRERERRKRKRVSRSYETYYSITITTEIAYNCKNSVY